MPIKWKNTASRLKPEVVLRKIAKLRVRSPDGQGASFHGWDIDHIFPSLYSMLEFPSIARDMDQATLIWKAVVHDPDDLTKDSFLKELNKQLSVELSRRVETFQVLTSISIDSQAVLGKIAIGGVELNFSGASYPRKFSAHRKTIISDRRVPATESPQEYQRVVATVKEKQPALAFAVGLRAVNLYRAIWCLLCNPPIEIIGCEWLPINIVRLGAIHTIHCDNQRITGEEVWFEPHHVFAMPFAPRQALAARQRVHLTLRKLMLSPYREDIIESLLLYVRALDEWNQNTALTRLWSAVERLASPGIGNYDAVVRRCAFLWKDSSFAMQTLEHLREYRNSCIHHGAESTQAKTYCFQLQLYFKPLVFFHIDNEGKFKTIHEANNFLDLPTDPVAIKDLLKNLALARRFREPSTPRKS